MKLKFRAWYKRKKLSRLIMEKYNYNNRRLKKHIKKLVMIDGLTNETIAVLEDDFIRLDLVFRITRKDVNKELLDE